MGCRSCEMACAIEHSISKNLISSISEKPVPVRLLYVEKAEGRNVPMICRHCQDAPCVAVCRTGALVQDSLSGVVERIEENCMGCWMCAMICPYGVVGRKKEVRMAVKCDRCKSLEVPACVAACPTGALIYSTQFSDQNNCESASDCQKTLLINLGKTWKMGEGSLHPQPKGWGIRDPPRSLCIKLFAWS